jgi:hypothetical protein
VKLTTLSPREASIFACVCDTVVAPEPALPPVRDTDAVESLDRWLARAPRLNRAGLRLLLYAAELSPRLLGQGTRLRRLSEPDRARALDAVEGIRSRQVREIVRALKGVACLCYYGDDAVMRRLGYDAGANVARGRELRALEGRP